jgi:putative transposase
MSTILPSPKQKNIKYGGKKIGNTAYATGSHSVFRLLYHVVLVTKFRKSIISKNRLAYLCALLPRVAAHYKYRIVEVNGESDHIHFILECPPSTSVSNAVARIKSVSAKFFLNRYAQ